MSKIKDPKQTKPKMGVAPDELVTVFLQLDAELGQVQHLIELANQTIQEQKQKGQVLIGKLDIIARQLNGMGIDPRDYTPEQETSSSEEDTFSDEIEENVPEVFEPKGDPRVTALTNRFRK